MYLKYYNNFNSILHLNKFVACFEEFYFWLTYFSHFDWHFDWQMTYFISFYFILIISCFPPSSCSTLIVEYLHSNITVMSMHFSPIIQQTFVENLQWAMHFINLRHIAVKMRSFLCALYFIKRDSIPIKSNAKWSVL